MGFKRKLKYALVHVGKLSNKAAQQALDAGQVAVNDVVAFDNILITDTDQISIDGHTIRASKKMVYYKFHKPQGFQSSLNKLVLDNLSGFFEEEDLAIAGRLDKQSEGLLLLSNDGKWIEQVCNPKFAKEKEYLVELDLAADEEFIAHFRSGVRLGDGYLTLPCVCEKQNGTWIKVILKEGKNRQIRRMCHHLSRGVKRLKRVRINDFELVDLAIGDKIVVTNLEKL